jgi:hypothetical protein
LSRQGGGQPGGAAPHPRGAAPQAHGGGAAADQEAGEGNLGQGAAECRGGADGSVGGVPRPQLPESTLFNDLGGGCTARIVAPLRTHVSGRVYDCHVIKCACKHARAHAHVHTHACARTRTRAHTHTHTHTHTNTHTRARVGPAAPVGPRACIGRAGTAAGSGGRPQERASRQVRAQGGSYPCS